MPPRAPSWGSDWGSGFGLAVRLRLDTLLADRGVVKPSLNLMPQSYEFGSPAEPVALVDLHERLKTELGSCEQQEPR